MFFIKNDWNDTNSVHKCWTGSQSVNKMNGWGYLYKITVLGPSQYPNTERSPNQ